MELFLDMGAVGLDRLGAEVQAFCDILCGDALADELENLELSGAECIGARLSIF